MMKILKYFGLFLLVLIAALASYTYSLTFTPHGRMDWRQAAYAKIFTVVIAPQPTDVARLVQENLEKNKPETILPAVSSFQHFKITADSLPVYVYKSANIKPNSPVVIYFHGGGFVIPLISDGHRFARKYANAFDAIIVAVDYRVAPQYPYPAAVNDCYNTFKWVLENAKTIGGNPEKIAVIGESAGGNLAAVVSQKALKDGYTNIKHQTLFCPSTDIAHVYSYPSNKALQNGYILDKKFMDYFFDAYLPNKSDTFNADASPLLQSSFVGLPQAFVITAQFDPIKDEGVAYYHKLKQAGVPTKYKNMEGCLHVVQGPWVDNLNDDLNKEIAVELAKAFK